MDLEARFRQDVLEVLEPRGERRRVRAERVGREELLGRQVTEPNLAGALQVGRKGPWLGPQRFPGLVHPARLGVGGAPHFAFAFRAVEKAHGQAQRTAHAEAAELRAIGGELTEFRHEHFVLRKVHAALGLGGQEFRKDELTGLRVDVQNGDDRAAAFPAGEFQADRALAFA